MISARDIDYFDFCHALLLFSGFWRLHRDGYQKHSVGLCLQVGGSCPWGGNEPNKNHQRELLRLWQGYFPQVLYIQKLEKQKGFFLPKGFVTFPPQPNVINRLYLCLNNLCRVYQDAEVNITQNFTSQKPVSLPPKRSLPNTMTSILELDPDSIVFYVGGYPEDFTVTKHCCLFHYTCIYLIFTWVETVKALPEDKLVIDLNWHPLGI